MNLSQWLEAHGDDAQFALFAAGFVAFAVLERALAHRTMPQERRTRWPANLGLTLLNVVALGLMPASFVGIARLAEGKDIGLLHSVALAPWLIVVATLLLRGFVSFITHLLMHKVPLLWRVHRVHHTDTQMDVSTTVRFHPLEFFIGLGIGLPFVLALGLSPWVLALYELFDIVVTLFSHANLRLPARFERVLGLFLVTPGLHRVHHSTHPDETDSNFGAVFPLWDMVFGTYRTTTREESATMPFGLAEARGTRTQSIPWLLAVPFRSDIADRETEARTLGEHVPAGAP
ncbi:MAG TPA: sterol desaturase family protein [Polyangiaceae bacterium]